MPHSIVGSSCGVRCPHPGLRGVCHQRVWCVLTRPVRCVPSAPRFFSWSVFTSAACSLSLAPGCLSRNARRARSSCAQHVGMCAHRTHEDHECGRCRCWQRSADTTPRHGLVVICSRARPGCYLQQGTAWSLFAAGHGLVLIAAGHGLVLIVAGHGLVVVSAGHGLVVVCSGALPGCCLQQGTAWLLFAAGHGLVLIAAGHGLVLIAAGHGLVVVCAGHGLVVVRVGHCLVVVCAGHSREQRVEAAAQSGCAHCVCWMRHTVGSLCYAGAGGKGHCDAARGVWVLHLQGRRSRDMRMLAPSHMLRGVQKHTRH